MKYLWWTLYVMLCPLLLLAFSAFLVVPMGLAVGTGNWFFLLLYPLFAFFVVLLIRLTFLVLDLAADAR